MTAIREFIKVKNRRIVLDLPEDFNYENVEIVIMPAKEEDWEYWSEKEIGEVGKIGLISSSFEDDDEDYSKW